MLSGPAIAALLTYVLMLFAVRFNRIRSFHVSVMVGIVIFDIMMPFYLYSTRDWYTRLIVHGDLFSFLIWMHFGLLITLYVLYVLQIPSGRRLLRNDNEQRLEHRRQAVGILIVRALVILTGALLADPADIR